MPTTPLRKIQTVVTGVAGSPWYLTGYFTEDTGTVNQCIAAWHAFTTGPASGLPGASTWRTGDDVKIIDPTNGEVIGVEAGIPSTLTGSNVGQRLAPATQALVRWRTANFVAGREVRGHTNMPGQMAGNANVDGSPSTALIGAYNSRAEALIADANTVHVVWSKKHGVWWATSSASTWSRYAVLRSRRD